MIRAVDKPDPTEYLGTVIGGRYVIDELLGTGGFAFVFKGRSKQKKKVAIKILHSTDAVALARFHREIKVLKGLPANPYVVEHVDDGQTADGRPYLVLDYIEGTTVMQMMSRYRRLEPRSAARFVAVLCEAFVGLHQLGVAHRDVKPENILVAFDGRIKLIDFGLVRDAQGILRFLEQDDPLENRYFSEELDQRILVGTPEYMAPEQFSDALHADASESRTDTWSDVFSLGVILYEMITGRNPFPIKRQSGRHSSNVEIFSYMRWRLTLTDADVPPCPGINPSLDSVLRKALRFDPRQRQRDAKALKADLDHFLRTGHGVRTSYDSFTLNVTFAELEARARAKGIMLETPMPDALDGPDTSWEADRIGGGSFIGAEETTNVDAPADEPTSPGEPPPAAAAQKPSAPPSRGVDLGMPIVIIDLPPPRSPKPQTPPAENAPRADLPRPVVELPPRAAVELPSRTGDTARFINPDAPPSTRDSSDELTNPRLAIPTTKKVELPVPPESAASEEAAQAPDDPDDLRKTSPIEVPVEASSSPQDEAEASQPDDPDDLRKTSRMEPPVAQLAIPETKKVEVPAQGEPGRDTIPTDVADLRATLRRASARLLPREIPPRDDDER
jgi:serine/threonine protein kinase